MAQVPQRTLNWLWSVLQREYRDAQRTYSDVAQTLSLYPAFAPRTDAYTFENGTSALLLHLNGALPVTYRGVQYRFPIAIWLPHAFPLDPPIVYVTPTDDMVVRPGQYVSSDGKIYHPYLARWRETWDRSSTLDFLKVIADVFAREPPVMSRQPQRPSASADPSVTQQPPPRPPLPGQAPVGSPRPLSVAPGPPPPPPKGAGQANSIPSPSPSNQLPTKPGRYDAPAPLPGQNQPRSSSLASSAPQQYQQPPQIRPQPPPPGHQQPQIYPPPQPVSAVQYQQSGMLPQPAPGQSQPPHLQGPSQSQGRVLPAGVRPQHIPPNQPQQYQPGMPPQPYQHFQPPPQAQPPKPVQPNLMDESPFDISLPKTSANLPTPEIPPNPEKQHILQTLQSTLLDNLQNQITQSNSALAPLQSQHAALMSAQHNLQAELSQLQTLQSQLQSNISSLTSTISTADRTITSARSSSSPDKIPAIDDLIIPPTVVARQLYDSVADQRGYEAAIYALTEGLVRGRIGGDLWARKSRECAREEFRRKWLVKRIGKGMALDVTVLE